MTQNGHGQSQAVDDRLPPHEERAERSVLGCIVMDENKLAMARERLQSEMAFFDLRNRTVWIAMCGLADEGRPIDMITLASRLGDTLRLGEIGGVEYLAHLQDEVPSAENIDAYLDIVVEKFIARKGVEFAATFEAQARGSAGVSESVLAAAKQKLGELESQSLAHLQSNPKNLCACSEFGEEYFKTWFERSEDDFGYPLPFAFPMRIRPSEMTLFTGDNGSGKSSMLGLISITCGLEFKPGERVVIASMEVPPEVTLWIMSRQLLGIGPPRGADGKPQKLPRTPENQKKLEKALLWLNERVLLYNFLGITDWRELLNTFRYAQANRGGKLFIVDSVMRIGIPDDDYALQGVVAAQFADFCVKTGAHVFLVVHENKGDGRVKDKVRGSKQWTDNAHNVCGMQRNEAKAQKREELKAELEAFGDKPEERAEIIKKMEAQRKQWDAKFILSKQRWPGSQQNGSRWLYFDHVSLQFHEQPDQGAIDFTLR